jgi:hypothetical protein
MKLLVLALALSSAFAFGQTAKVIALSPSDAREAKQLEQAVSDSIKAREDFRETIVKKYLITEFVKQTGLAVFKDGWTYGDFEFSDDFLFIVPNSTLSYYKSNSNLVITNTNCPDYNTGPFTLLKTQ